MKTNAYAAQNATTPLAPFTFERRELGEDDVQIEILYCGVCHSDLHTVRSEWQGTTYPCVPVMKLSGELLMLARKSINLNKAIRLESVAWSIPAAPVLTVWKT
jgi:uncharacterized zinc-type alcohol dehydrogenase-like protein